VNKFETLECFVKTTTQCEGVCTLKRARANLSKKCCIEVAEKKKDLGPVP
jgi:hypothetical protein